MRAIFLLSLVPALFACTSTAARDAMAHDVKAPPSHAPLEVATFAAGCYWCVEAAYERLVGVVDVRSGFMGGAEVDTEDPRALIEAGHAEVVQVTFDTDDVSYDELLVWFWRMHDPTSVDRQGEDEGHEYRSEIFVHSARQNDLALASRARAEASSLRPIVTAITPAGAFHEAPEDQQDYYRRNRENEHCRNVIAPHLLSIELAD